MPVCLNSTDHRGFLQGGIPVSFDEDIQRRAVDKNISGFIHELDPVLPQLVGHCLSHAPGHKDEFLGLVGPYQRKQCIRRGYHGLNFRSKIQPLAMSSQRKASGVGLPDNLQRQPRHPREGIAGILDYVFFIFKFSHIQFILYYCSFIVNISFL